MTKMWWGRCGGWPARPAWGRQPCLQQRHLGGALRQEGGRPRLGQDRRLPEGETGL